MYLVTFEFTQERVDDEWRALNDRVQAAAESNPDYAGREVWLSPDGDRTLVAYRWETLEGLQAFREHEVHREAKARYEEWYGGYEVTVAQVVAEYGDGGLD